MDEHLRYLRREYGDVFVTQLPTGQSIPWRPLTIGEYLEYNRILRTEQYPPAYIENEIFIKCVLDGAFVQSIDKLKAGIVSTVASCIMSFSGPQSVDDLNQNLDIARHLIDDATHELVSLICQAFPAYKPEDVYAMDQKTLMIRAAQAERKMLTLGLIDEPIIFEPKEQIQEQEEENSEKQQKRLEDNQQMLEKYYQQQGIEVPTSMKKSKKKIKERITDHPKPPPIPDMQHGEHTIITKSDMMEHEAVMTGHEQDIVHKTKATDETAQFYTKYLDQLKNGEQLKIQTPE
jgi:hypothetical protein